MLRSRFWLIFVYQSWYAWLAFFSCSTTILVGSWRALNLRNLAIIAKRYVWMRLFSVLSCNQRFEQCTTGCGKWIDCFWDDDCNDEISLKERFTAECRPDSAISEIFIGKSCRRALILLLNYPCGQRDQYEKLNICIFAKSFEYRR